MSHLTCLVEALCCLPGIGAKSAQRMAFYLLQHQRQRGLNLARCLETAMHNIQYCQQCNNFSEQEICSLCQSSERDQSVLCIVESPADVIAIEHTRAYDGCYFVLMGKISPLHGFGPSDMPLDKLLKRINQNTMREIILALSPSVEGQTTIYFIRELLEPYVLHISQLAHGIPSGGELDYLDSHTIGSALRNRATITANHA